ncbi:MAG: hypothetical protein ACYCSN_13480 [Acidobacteriaceae bacterium]
MAKSPEQWSAGYTRRVENWAKKHGYTLDQVQRDPSLRKQARGHKRSEGHGFSVHDAKHLSHAVKEVGVPVNNVKDYKGSKTPKASDVKKALGEIKGENLAIYVQVISSEDSPGRRKQGEGPGKSIDWISIKDTKKNLLEEIDLLPENASGFDLLTKIFELDRPVEAVIAWQIRDLDSEKIE